MSSDDVYEAIVVLPREESEDEERPRKWIRRTGAADPLIMLRWALVLKSEGKSVHGNMHHRIAVLARKHELPPISHVYLIHFLVHFGQECRGASETAREWCATNLSALQFGRPLPAKESNGLCQACCDESVPFRFTAMDEELGGSRLKLLGWDKERAARLASLLEGEEEESWELYALLLQRVRAADEGWIVPPDYEHIYARVRKAPGEASFEELAQVFAPILHTLQLRNALGRYADAIMPTTAWQAFDEESVLDPCWWVGGEKMKAALCELQENSAPFSSEQWENFIIHK